jgi:tRNA pseudouridine55 synthase
MTSRDVVNVVQRRLPRKTKVGHAGTLDPLAEGVLVLGVGPAVRLVPYVQQQPKHYQATFRIGSSSVSGDLEGEITDFPDLPIPTRDQLNQAALNLTGEIEQIPPAHSAIWVDGQRAYRRIRAGEEFEMPSRKVQINTLEITRYAFPEVDLNIICGSGTYIRTLGIDLAVHAGSTAVMSFLSRIGVGPFHLKNSVSIDALREDDLEPHFLPASLAIQHLPCVKVTDEDATRLGHGLCLDQTHLDETNPSENENIKEVAAMTQDGQLRAIVRLKRGQWCPYRVFPTREPE